MIYDVIIIGAGVSGAFTARVLSRYQLKVCLLDRESDVAMGASRANSGIIHAGYDAEPGSLKAALNELGNRMMESTAKELDVPFKRTGSLVLAFDESERHVLEALMKKGLLNGVKGLAILEKEELMCMEPNISENALFALYAPSAGIICPYELTAAAAENAVENGVELRLENEVVSISLVDDIFELTTGKDVLKCRYIVNAAGIYADTIAGLIGDDSFLIGPRKGEYLLFDKSQGGIINKVIFQCPSDKGKGILITSTVDGNLLIGPNATDLIDKEDTSTSVEGLEEVIRGAGKSVYGLDMQQVISSFAGLRARSSTGDFIIQASKKNNHFINVVGIESPGLSAALAVGEYTAQLLNAQGLSMVCKESYNPIRKPVLRIRDLGEKELNNIIKSYSSYGRIICRCEKVSEGEIVDCINKPAGARTLDAVKRRTRAGMGRCQGGFCSPRIMEILARELDIPMEQITKSGGKSWMLAGKVRQDTEAEL